MRSLSEKPLDCPFCGEPISVVVDHSIGEQEYIEDCQVCCRPIVFLVRAHSEGGLDVEVRTEDNTCQWG